MDPDQIAGNKVIRVQNYYRQWGMLDKNGNGIPNTETPKNQNIRFLKVAEIWSQQIQKYEVISISDTNINLKKNYNNTNELKESDKKLIPIFRILQKQIFNMGASVIQTKPTKIYEDKPNTFIDHLISNFPQKIIHHQVLDYAFSDHLMVLFTVYNKKVIHKQKFKMVRKFEKVDWDQLTAELYNDNRIQLAEVSQDANVICESIMDTVKELID